MCCKNCGNEIKEKQKFCNKCGAQVDSTATKETPDNAAHNNEINPTLHNTKKIETMGSKHKRKKIIVSAVSVLVVISLIIAGVLIFNKKNNECYMSKSTVTQYDEGGNKVSVSITENRADGQIISETTINEDSEYSIKYTYDDDGKVSKILFEQDDENIGTLEFTYESSDETSIGTADGKIDDEYSSFKRIYNKNNVLIYESEKIGSDEEVLTEKEYNDDGKLLTEHTLYKSFLNNTDHVIENKYEKEVLISTSVYVNDELLGYSEFYPNGQIKFEDSYSNGELSEHIEYDKDGYSHHNGVKYWFENIYDDNGNPIERNYYVDDNIKQSAEYEWKK